MKLARYLYISPWRMWWWMIRSCYPYSRFGLFRNLPHVKPGRWGFYLLGIEIGSRNPQDPVGAWLKSHGLWRW